MVNLSQSLTTQTNRLLPHCHIAPNATGGAVTFSMSVHGRCVLQRTDLVPAAKAHTVDLIVKKSKPQCTILNF